MAVKILIAVPPSNCGDVVVRAPEFDDWSSHCRKKTLGKLFTYICSVSQKSSPPKNFLVICALVVNLCDLKLSWLLLNHIPMCVPIFSVVTDLKIL